MLIVFQTFIIDLRKIVIVVGLLMIRVVIVIRPHINKVTVDMIGVAVVDGDTLDSDVSVIFYDLGIRHRDLDRILTVSVDHRLSGINAEGVVDVIQVAVEGVDIRRCSPAVLQGVEALEIEGNAVRIISLIIDRSDLDLFGSEL